MTWVYPGYKLQLYTTELIGWSSADRKSNWIMMFPSDLLQYESVVQPSGLVCTQCPKVSYIFINSTGSCIPFRLVKLLQQHSNFTKDKWCRIFQILLCSCRNTLMSLCNAESNTHTLLIHFHLDKGAFGPQFNDERADEMCEFRHRQPACDNPHDKL